VTPQANRARPRQALLSAFALAAACAHRQPQQRRIDIAEPVVITPGPPAQVALGDMDEATLFDGGTRAFAASEFQKASDHFDRLVDAFPGSAQRLPALYNSALAQERLSRWPEALARFDSYLQLKPGDVDAQFHAAVAEYKLGRLADAARRLHALSQRPEVPAPRKAEALVQEAVCQVESGARADGEKTLRAALALLDKTDDADPALAAQGEFWLGEVYRSYFRDAQLDPAQMDEKKLSESLETKAEFLLSAQGHYLRAIRKGDGEWATASGFRIGELYEAFHDQLSHAPLPPGLTGEQQGVYRDELRKKVKTLVGKAIGIYEQTLATAQRVGAKNAYVDKTEAALERLKKLMLGTN
jgi:tetratricopeptide (TPR) repeat protein